MVCSQELNTKEFRSFGTTTRFMNHWGQVSEKELWITFREIADEVITFMQIISWIRCRKVYAQSLGKQYHSWLPTTEAGCFVDNIFSELLTMQVV